MTKQPYQHKPFKGSLFKNTYKQQGDKKPDLTGSCFIPEPGNYKIALWVEPREDGSKKYSLSFTPLDMVPEQTRPIAKVDDEFNDEIPGFGAETTKAPF